MQAGAWPYPAPPFPKQHQAKPGIESRLDPRAFVFLASAHCSSYITGEVLPVIGGN